MFAKRLCAIALSLSLASCVPIASFTGEMRNISSRALLHAKYDVDSAIRCTSSALSAIDQATDTAIGIFLPKDIAVRLKIIVNDNCEVINGLVTSGTPSSISDREVAPARVELPRDESTSGSGCGGTGSCAGTADTSVPSTATK